MEFEYKSPRLLCKFPRIGVFLLNLDNIQSIERNGYSIDILYKDLKHSKISLSCIVQVEIAFDKIYNIFIEHIESK